MREKLRRGVWPIYAPLGYVNDRKNRVIIPDPERAPYIKKIFEVYATANFSLYELMQEVKTWGLIGRKGKPVHKSKIARLLQNPFYYGVIRFKGEMYEGSHPPLISKKLFDKCQEVLKQRSKPHKNRPKYFTFRGFIKCGECGAMITAENQKGHNYYRCTKRLGPCRQKYIREEVLAEQVKRAIQKVSLSDDWTNNILRELNNDKQDFIQSSLTQRQNLQKEIYKTDTKINKLIDIYLEGVISLEEYQAKKEKLINKKKDLQEKLRDFAAEGNNWFEQAKDFVSSLNRAHYLAGGANYESQKEFLKKIGSNFLLKERRLYFSSQNPYSLVAESEKNEKNYNWRSVLNKVRTYFQKPLL